MRTATLCTVGRKPLCVSCSHNRVVYHWKIIFFYFPTATSECHQYRRKVFSFAFVVEVNYLQQRQYFNRIETRARRRCAEQEGNFCSRGRARFSSGQIGKHEPRKSPREGVKFFFLYFLKCPSTDIRRRLTARLNRGERNYVRSFRTV